MKKKVSLIGLILFFKTTLFAQIAREIQVNDKEEYTSLWNSLDAILIAVAIVLGIFLARRWSRKITKKRDEAIEKWEKEEKKQSKGDKK